MLSRTSRPATAGADRLDVQVRTVVEVARVRSRVAAG
jgi:hypothetical protein